MIELLKKPTTIVEINFSHTSFQDVARISTPIMMGFLNLCVTDVYLEHAFLQG